jgi:2-polyprenyl-3-methyl-5-hydroxy-6-metoxy-1,4-benzoquinol methylase
MKNSCLVCGNSTFEKIYNETLLKCTSCGFVTANMNISEENLRNIYTENYFKGEEYADYLRDKNVLQRNFSRHLSFIISEIEIDKITNVLEIGSAYGFFAELFTNIVKSADFLGLDIAEEAIKYGQQTLKQNLKCEDYLVYPSPQKKYTDVFMWDVIEHLPSPEKVIEKISNEIEQDGRIFITTGDIDTLVPRIQKQNWRMIHPPSHLHYFSKKTISLLLERSGFDVTHVKYPSVSRSVKLIFYSLFILNKKQSKFKKKIYNLIPDKWYFLFNSFDIMFIIAQKNQIWRNKNDKYRSSTL